ncbi:TetR/AcrR family transcriptional regulator [Streptomyces bacillaris]|uniref:TetR/AcrR family transcriptional regulator n=1 Tax=Streptomyces cavourensis TaxID=67258 RepID=A0ABY5F665_9ACTN|nr:MULTISPECIES: TetR/AcrR family transcriptional regulator [Streptomyces]NUW25003.1 TetR/AcrR family transcriptional regulator [Streptomyces roseoviolaceus]ATY98975.1 TetR/AcrR family transcriptional regulator [Streptomyces cavourensis]MBH0245748.1 TetR/AcrR family transcriptional regulator [Streptomyces cavourensis]NUV44501.1 TetR/AcrR family transcriptional regulator [Streptomyces sp. CAI-24]NUV84532.1 TetR/AcrR family transcriptional regulator [Streptomyces sp. CAI-155]
MDTGAFLSYLEGRQVRWRITLDECLRAAGPDPRRRLLAVFDALKSLAADGLRCGAFVNAQFELGEPQGPCRTAIAETKRCLRADVLELARATGAVDPELLADQLLLVYEGAVANHSLGNVADPVGAAHQVARRLIAAASPRPLDAFWVDGAGSAEGRGA